MKKQPKPKKNSHPAVMDLVFKDLEQRRKSGLVTYGVPLQPFNDRDAVQDLYEELLDLVLYIRQFMYERDHKIKRPRLMK